MDAELFILDFAPFCITLSDTKYMILSFQYIMTINRFFGVTFIYNFSSEIVIYHDGSDGGQFDYVEAWDSEGDIYRCYFDGFIDGSAHLDHDGCVRM
jgi:hypothetical protein